MKERPAILPADAQALTASLFARAWNTSELGMVLGTLFLLYFLASFVGLFFYEEQIPAVRILVTVLIYTVVMVLITRINRRRGDSWAAGFGMSRKNLKKLWLAPLLYLAMLPLLLATTKIWHLLLQHVFGLEVDLQEVSQIFMQELSGLQVLYLLMAVFVAPLFEEILFRGLVFPYLVKRTGLAEGTLLVSVLFAVMHFHLPSFVPLLLLSAALCGVYWRTGSLWVGIGLHTVFNAVSILGLYALK